MFPDLSIILLVWRDAEFLPACLDSITVAVQNLACQVIVVANGIETASLHARLSPLASRFSNLESLIFIHNLTNRGVAPARNQGLAAARGRYLMLLDTDTRVAPDALATLVHFMDSHPEVGLAGPRLQDASGHLQLTARRLPTVWSKLLRRLPTHWAQDALADEQLAHWNHAEARAVDYVIGACQIIRREAYEQVGALDELFFYGPEDVDYCVRMWQSGWQVLYVPQAVVTHYEQRLTRQRALSKLSLIHLVGLARYFAKYRYVWTRPDIQHFP